MINNMCKSFKTPFIINISTLSGIFKYLPIIIVMSYLLMTIIFFTFGPNEWPIKNPVKLYTFLFFANTSLLIGYILGTKKRKLVYRCKSFRPLFRFSLLVYFLFLPITSYARTGNVIPDVLNAITNFGKAYYESKKVAWPEYLRMMVSPALIACVPLGIYKWDQLRRLEKILLLFSIIYYISIDISRGKNKSLADYLIIFTMILMLKKIKLFIDKTGSYVFHLNKRMLRILIMYFIIISLLGWVFFNYFTMVISSRTYSLYNSFTGNTIQIDNVLLAPFKTELQKYGAAKLMAYLSQGYYGLSLALDKPFHFSYGIGYSLFLLENAEEILGLSNVKKLTYSYKLYDDNWPTGRVWSSFYVWPASDITFFGVILLMFIIGFIYATVWLESLLSNDHISLIIFSLLNILLFYIPANNQLFQEGETFFGSWFWFLYWFLRRIYFTKKHGVNAKYNNVITG